MPTVAFVLIDAVIAVVAASVAAAFFNADLLLSIVAAVLVDTIAAAVAFSYRAAAATFVGDTFDAAVATVASVPQFC